jgi:hypothetical protein
MPDLATLIESQRQRLSQTLGEHSIETEDRQAGRCSIKTPTLTLHIYRRPKTDVIESAIELRTLPPHPVKLSDQLHTWLILKSRGEPWPTPAAGTPENILSEELDRVSRALRIMEDDEERLETLLWEAGYRDGWLRWG